MPKWWKSSSSDKKISIERTALAALGLTFGLQVRCTSLCPYAPPRPRCARACGRALGQGFFRKLPPPYAPPRPRCARACGRALAGSNLLQQRTLRPPSSPRASRAVRICEVGFTSAKLVFTSAKLGFHICVVCIGEAMREGLRSGDCRWFLAFMHLLRPLSSPRALGFHIREVGFYIRDGGIYIREGGFYIHEVGIHKNVSSCFSVCLLFLPLMAIPLFHPRRAYMGGRLSITALILAHFYHVTC